MVALSPFTNSARKVPLQHMQKAVLEARGMTVDPPLPGPNKIQLFSFYKPGLLAGNYVIEAEQTITSQSPKWGQEQYQIFNRKILRDATGNPTNDGSDREKPVEWPQDATKPDYAPQTFTVVAPQFNIDSRLIDSYYPPDGHQDECRILPHLVIKDEHFPWERQADGLLQELWDPDLNTNNQFIDNSGNIIPNTDPKLAEKQVMRNCLPWVALMVFDIEDLPPLTTDDVTALQLPSTIDLQHQPSNGAFQMTVEQYFKMNKTSLVDFETAMTKTNPDPDGWTSIQASQEKMTTIFPRKQTFLNLFPDISTLRYSAHVRNVNTAGFPGSGINETGLYSILISSRMANYAQTSTVDPKASQRDQATMQKPTTQIVHLVSIENFEQTKRSIQNRGDNLTDRIALISLYSWTYLALPPNPVNFINSIENVLSGMQYLRPLDNMLNALANKTVSDANQQKALSALSQRLKTGYTLARWRAETGEETVAWNRGPLVPCTTTWPPVADWPTHSNTSKDYQILDTTTGIMDLSYSSAWQLGKTLAISDTSFSSALSRLRSAIQTWAASQTRAQTNSMTSRKALIANLGSTTKALDALNSGNVSDPRRITAPTNRTLAPPLDDPSVTPIFRANIKNAVWESGSTVGGELWNEFNQAGHKNSDWTIIHTWISEKLSLADIPAHILIPDPSFLPEESLRFFYIDDNWMDCLIDGALSVANHLEKDSDVIREEIKNTYNAYLGDTTTLPHPPQIPRYGFILRSQIVKAMPDLKITIDWNPNPTTEATFCRYIRPDDHTIFCLLERPPEDLNFIQLAQPPHQQRFSFGRNLTQDNTIDGSESANDPKRWHSQVSLRMMFTDKTDAKLWTVFPPKDPNQVTIKITDDWFNSDTRVINLKTVANSVNQRVRAEVNTTTSIRYDDYVPNSAELALQLNDPSYYFQIAPPGSSPSPKPIQPVASTTRTATPRNRKLWCAGQIPETQPTEQPPDPNPPPSGPIGPPPPPPVLSTTTEPTHPTGSGDTPANASRPKIIFQDTNPVPANPKQPLGTATPLQCFTVQIYADYKGPPTFWPADGPMSFDKNNYLPTKNDYLYDLIFSVRKIPTRSKVDLDMREIIINIPTTGIKSGEPLIDSSLEGPRAKILDNMRFVPFLNWTTEYLQVRLVPRSAQDSPVIKINDGRTTEISFRLEDVNIPLIRKAVPVSIHGQSVRDMVGLVEIKVYERYATAAGDVSASPIGLVHLIKRDIRDAVTYK